MHSCNLNTLHLRYNHLHSAKTAIPSTSSTIYLSWLSYYFYKYLVFSPPSDRPPCSIPDGNYIFRILSSRKDKIGVIYESISSDHFWKLELFTILYLNPYNSLINEYSAYLYMCSICPILSPVLLSPSLIKYVSVNALSLIFSIPSFSCWEK